ncbi:MAG: amidase, partial [Deltaproteobacteria bacterium]|nr:amidase [Deltaproteobacteria bacterium]
MNFHEYRGYDAVGLAKLVAAGEVTAAELVELAVAAAQRVNGKLNAVVHERYQRARAEAANPRTGVFRGVPFLLKDLLGHMEGEPMCSGSRAYASFVSDHNSELVNRYLGSGVIVLGKTNTPEFGLVATTESALLGPCRNPWNLR